MIATIITFPGVTALADEGTGGADPSSGKAPVAPPTVEAAPATKTAPTNEREDAGFDEPPPEPAPPPNPPPVPVAQPAEIAPWKVHGDITFDWLETTSGEWLKGELKALRDGDLLFDSDKFELQEMEWDDVAAIHSPNRFRYVLRDRTVHTGAADLEGGTFTVYTREGPLTFSRKDIMSIIPEKTREISKWSFKLSLGSTLRMGNTRSLDTSAFSRIRREDAFNRADLDYNGQVGFLDDALNTNKHRGNLTWNLFVSPRFFVTPIFSEVLYDLRQNIDVQYVVAAGGGVHIVDIDNLTIDFHVAVGYGSTTFHSMAERDAESRRHGVLGIPELTIEWEIVPDVELDLNWRTMIVLTHVAWSYHRGTARFSVGLNDTFDLALSAIYDRQESPVENAEGEVPKKDDLALTLGIGIDIN